MRRWSNPRLIVVTQRGTIRSSSPVPTTQGRRSIDPSTRMADSSRLTTGVPALSPNTPTLVMEKVPPV